MVALLYSAGIALLRVTYGIAALGNPKAKRLLNGQRSQKAALRAAFTAGNKSPLAWFHCASLGEFEQGRPVIEALKAARPDVRILLTFFSPSGYEVRKDYPLADFVFYLPWDTAANASFFAEVVQPYLAVFVKYEFWYHYSAALHRRQIPLVSISAIFRPDHIYFKPQGFLFRSILRNFSHFFIQNQQSFDLLKRIGISAASVAGDTRFDRVLAVLGRSEENETARNFKNGKQVMVIGSAWPDDMAVLLPFMNEYRDVLRFIVAPHEINEAFMTSIEKQFQGKTVRYTQTNQGEAAVADVLVIDTIGLLSVLYRYGEYAFVGGGFKEGLHNILEAACYGIPVFFGSKAPYNKYQEALDLVSLKGAFGVADTHELTLQFRRLLEEPEVYKEACSVSQDYVQTHAGATPMITQHLLNLFASWKAE